MALSGQGGDELFGGYPSFADVPALLRGLPFREKLADMLRAGADLSALSLQRRRCFSNAQIRALLGGSVPEPNASDGFIDRGQLADLPIRQRDAVHGVSLLESRFYLGNTLLPVGDSTGMAHGLEIRFPMLDRPLLDLALSLPGAVRLPKGKADKSLLRRGFPDLLRPALLRQSKRGFVIPVRRWMVVAEALTHGVPVLTTTATPWQALESENCGWWVSPTSEAIARGLAEVVAASDETRKAMGMRALVKRQFAWRAIIKNMRASYESIVEQSRVMGKA